jgi:hypothetical protein
VTRKSCGLSFWLSTKSWAVLLTLLCTAPAMCRDVQMERSETLDLKCTSAPYDPKVDASLFQAVRCLTLSPITSLATKVIYIPIPRLFIAATLRRGLVVLAEQTLSRSIKCNKAVERSPHRLSQSLIMRAQDRLREGLVSSRSKRSVKPFMLGAATSVSEWT